MHHCLCLFLLPIAVMGIHTPTILYVPYAPFKGKDKIGICCSNKQLQVSVA